MKQMRNLMIDVIKNTSSLYRDDPLDTIDWNQFTNKDLIKLYRDLVVLNVCSVVQCCNEDIGIDGVTSRRITNLIKEEMSSDDSEIFTQPRM